ncbi:MAG: phospho-sugar mutase [Deltaproteobacteria bacterium]|nr:phospho-sugar mutase [Deltaproteobacteria bacterium]
MAGKHEQGAAADPGKARGPTPASPALVAAGRAWLALDPEPEDKAALEAALAAAPKDGAALAAAFGERLSFGTAGIRGEMGFGTARMNRVMVRQTTAGLGRHLFLRAPTAPQAGVVIGYDGRARSRAFAEDTAAVLCAMGVRCYLFDAVVPTPTLAFAVTALGCAAGVMVTASHNPPQDNGYKVYSETGGQIIPPQDAEILAQIDAVVADGGKPALMPLAQAKDKGLLLAVPDRVGAAYIQGVLGLRVHGDRLPAVNAVYTAMHGVGYASLRAVLAAAGHAPVVPVDAQVEPDGAFPTVKFPNPEEKGALDLAKAKARAVQAALIIAHDPDADRLAVAIPDAAAEGGYRQLSGNEVGLLLAEDLLAHGPPAPARLLACSVVSSPLLHRIAAAWGARSVDTLTGFKWLADAALRFTARTPGGRFVLGFEEALGYSAGGLVRDKDGVSTALLMLDLAAWCAAGGWTLGEQLDALYRRYGLAGSAQRSVKVDGVDFLAKMGRMMAALRGQGPAPLGGRAVLRLRDLAAGTDADLVTGAVGRVDLPQSDVLIYDLQPQGDELSLRLIVRPSGTEPKVKVYVDRIVSAAPGPLERQRAAADGIMAGLAEQVAADLRALLAAPAPATPAAPAAAPAQG